MKENKETSNNFIVEFEFFNDGDVGGRHRFWHLIIPNEPQTHDEAKIECAKIEDIITKNHPPGYPNLLSRGIFTEEEANIRKRRGKNNASPTTITITINEIDKVRTTPI